MYVIFALLVFEGLSARRLIKGERFAKLIDIVTSKAFPECGIIASSISVATASMLGTIISRKILKNKLFDVVLYFNLAYCVAFSETFRPAL